MSSPRLRVLLIEDDKDDYILVCDLLRSVPFTVYDIEWAQAFDTALEAIHRGGHDVCLLDYRLGNHCGLELLRKALARGYDIPIIMLTGHGDHGVDIETMKAGASDYLDKSQVTSDLLERSMRCAIERKRAQRAQRESEERYRTLFDTASDAIFVHDLDGRFLDVNRKACECLGYSREELLQKTSGEIGANECGSLDQERMLALWDGGDLITETACIRQDGTKILVELSSRMVTYDGEPAVLSIARDVTERKRAEKMIRENLLFLQTLIDTVPSPIFLVDTEEVYRGCNTAFEDYLGLKKKGIIGKSIYDLYPVRLAEKFHRIDMDLFQNPRLFIHEATVPYADGARRSIILSKAPYLSTEGLVTGLVGVMVDVTPLKKARSELKEAKVKAESARRAKSDFMANMSHELRTPLNAIIGFTGLLIDSQAGDLSPLQAEYLKDVHRSAQHLLVLVSGILDFGRIEAKRLKLESSEVRLADLLTAGMTMIRPEAEKRCIRLHTELGPLPEVVNADERKLGQALHNLLSNAVKFTPEGGEVRLEARSVSRDELINQGLLFSDLPSFPSSGPERFVQISVTDTGIGIKAEDIKRIFDPFEQSDGSISRSYQGLGLGLTLSRDLVELHNGRLWAESRGDGLGSSFHILLPV